MSGYLRGGALIGFGLGFALGIVLARLFCSQ
jgi:hypothetical protein